MNLIIPMAGQGKRMRPHTLTTPKPLIPIAGKAIVARLVEELQSIITTPLHTIGFVVSLTPDPELKHQLTALAAAAGARAQFYVQPVPQGTAHAIHCAAELLQGPVMVAFADTLFKSHLRLEPPQQNVIWVKRVQNPSAFGVVQTDDQGRVWQLIEKPASPVSDLAIIGIYYFAQGAVLRQALEDLIAAGRPKEGEYLLTDALCAMMQQGQHFVAQPVEEWLDCGNKEATLLANQRFLTLSAGPLVDPTAQIQHSVLIPPVYLGPHVKITNSVIGPHVSIGDHSNVLDARLQNIIVQRYSTIENTTMKNSMVGNYVCLTGHSTAVSIGDYTTMSADD